MQTSIVIALTVALVGCGPGQRDDPSDPAGDCTGLVLACPPDTTHATPVAGMGDAVNVLRVAAIGDRYALGWYEGLGGAFVGIADGSGTLETQVQLSPAGLFTHVAWNGTELGAVYVDGDITSETRSLVFVRVDASGRIIGSRIPLDSVRSEDPTIAWSPVSREWAIMWEEVTEEVGYVTRVHFTRVDEHGAIVPGSTLVLSQHDQVAQLAMANTSLVWVGDVWAAVWSEIPLGRVRMARLDASGELLGVTSVADGVYNSFHSSIAGNCDGFGVAFEYALGSDVFSTRFVTLDRDGVLLPGEQTFAHRPAHAAGPNVVWAGTHYSVVYVESTSMTGRLWLADIMPDGTSRVRALSEETSVVWFAHAIWDGCRLVVAYTDSRSQQDGHLMFLP